MAGNNSGRICSKHGSISPERLDWLHTVGADFCVANSIGDAAHQLDGIFSGSDFVRGSELAAFNDRRRKKLVLSGPICNSGTGSLSVFGMHPNGLPLENGSSLLDGAAAVPGVLIGLTLLVLMTWVGSRLFGKGARKYD